MQLNLAKSRLGTNQGLPKHCWHQHSATPTRTCRRVHVQNPHLDSRRALTCSIARDQEVAPTQDAQVLRLLGRDLCSHCSTLGNGNYARECQKLHGWYTKKIADLEAFMTQDPSAPAYQEAEATQKTLRGLAMCGASITEIYHGLQVLKQVEEKQASGFKPPANKPFIPPLAFTSDPEGRALLVELFKRADSDKNGRLTWNEFNNALHLIKDDLSEEEQELVSSTLDLQGSVTLDQFLAIVESAEAARIAPASDASFLRHLTHHHPSELDHIRST